MVNMFEVSVSRTKMWLNPEPLCNSVAKHLFKSLTHNINVQPCQSTPKLSSQVSTENVIWFDLGVSWKSGGPDECYLKWKNSWKCGSHPWKLKSKSCVTGDSLGGVSQSSWGWRIHIVLWNILVAPPEAKPVQKTRFENEVTWPYWCDCNGRISWKCTCCTNCMKRL